MIGAVALPALAALAIWWSSTGLLFWLVQRPRASFKWTAGAMTVAAFAAMAGLVLLRDRTGLADAYLGFAIGITLWAWHETMFLLGYISGPRRTPCPPDLKAWPRFLVSTETVIYHEIAIALHGALIIALSWGADNHIAALTYLLLWGMRINAKFLVFLGVPNLSDGLLPSHLTYLSTYFGKRRVTAFFPILISLATIAATVLAFAALAHPAGTFGAVGYTLIAALAVLAVIEHWVLVLPVRDTALWPWARQSSTIGTPLENGASQSWRT